MRNLFTRWGSGFSITLLFVFCLLFAGRTNAQCNVTNTGSINAPTSCAGGSTSLGPGESRNMTFAATTWYTFSYSNGGNSYATGFCLNGSSYSSPTIVEPGATTWAVGIYRGSTPSTWSTTSATLTYVLTTPTAPTWHTVPTTVCSGTAVAYSVNAGSYNDYWLWSVTNGSVTSGQGTTSATITFSGTSPASITVTPYNGGASGCAGSALTSSSITVTAQPAINTTPTCSPATGTTICAGYNSGTVTGGAGTGGTSCTDSWTYSINNGISTSAYTNGSAISTTGGTTNIIVYQSRSAGTGAGCAAAGPTAICTWPVGSAAVAPTLSSASPASGNTVCTTYGNVSATATGGSGGSSGSANAYQYSINGGSNYSTYTSGSNIPTSGASGSIIVQAERTAGSYGCTTAGWNTIASWPIASPAVAPTLNVATPANGTAVCTSYGTVSCTTNAGSGGSTGAADAYQYSINNGSTWSTYTPGLGISTTSATGNIIIQAERTGTYCATVGWTTIATWPVNQLPTITLSSIATTCPGSNANLPYAATTNSPNQYSTAWGTTAISAGFTNVSNTSFTSSPIHLTVPSTAPLVPVGPYTGNITVTNSTTGCTSTSYAISVATGLSGTYTVGTGGNFSSLTAAVNYANTYGLCGPTVFKLISSTYSTSATSETFPIVINALSGSSSSNTLTIVPNTGVSPTITGSATYGLIQLNACSYVTINGSNSGGTTQNLTITNTNNSTGYATGIWVSNNAGLTTGASYNTIENCIITSVTGGSYYGFAGISQSSGTNPYTYATVANVNNTYTNNYIYSNWAVGIYLLGPSSLEAGNVITNNNIGTTSTSQMPYYYGIFVDEESGVQITGNTINGVYNTGTGSAADIGGIITGSNGLAGTTTSISNNTISNITATGTQWSNGIAIDGPWPGGTISGNIISSVTSSAFPSGISINGSVSSGSLSKNQISSITSTTSSANVTGIYLGSTTSSTGLTISNNYIWNITSKGYSTVSGNGIGIYAVSGGSYYFYFNTISLSTAQSSAGYPVALYVASGSTGNVAEDNIFSVSETGSTANYALYSSATSTPFTTINYNDYYVGAGTTYGYINGSSVTSIAGMATSFGGNTFSGNIQPNFVSSTNLDLNNYNNFCLASGIAISGISTDIHGTTRTVPVIGADEAQFAFTGTTAASTCLGSSSLITVSDASSTLASGSYTVVYSVSNPASAGNSATMTYASGTNSGTFTVPASLLTNAGSVTVTITSITPASPSCSSLAVKPMILTGASTNYATLTVYSTVVAPTISGTPSPSNASAVCANYGTLTANITAGSGGSTDAADAYQYSINGGSSYTSISPSGGVISISTSGATGNIILQAERTGGTSCSTVGWNTLYTWALQTAPVAPVLSGTPSPSNASAICANYGNLTANVTAGSGGGAGAADAYQYSLNGGSTFTTVFPSAGVITIPAGGATGSIILQAERTGGTNCNTVGWNTLYTWTLQTAPIAPVLSGTPSPTNASAVCANYGNLTANVSAGSGGGSGAADAYQYSINGGSTYTSVSPSGGVITIPAGGATGSIILQAERIGGTNCSTAGWNTLYTWTLQTAPVAPVLSGTPSPSNASAICAGYGTLTVNVTAGSGGGSGASDAYQYSKDGGSTYAPIYASGGVISIPTSGATGSFILQAERTGGTNCSTVGWNTLYTWTLQSTPVSAVLSGGTSPICNNTTPASFTTTAGGGSGTYAYLWYLNGSSTGITTSTYTTGSLTATSTVYCVVTSSGGCGSATTSSYTVSVDGVLSATLGGGTTPVCYNTTPASFTATVSGGSGTYSYLWYINNAATGITTSTYTTGNLTSTSTVYCAVTSTGGCGSTNTGTYTVNVDGALVAGISGGTSPICYNTAPGTFTVIGNGGTGTYTYQWYNSSGSISGATLSTYAPGNLTASDSYTCSVTSGTCGTVASNTKSIVVDANLTASISGGTSPICYNSDPGTITATGVGGTGTYTYQWYNGAGSISGATASTYDPGNITSSNSYTCSVTSGSCGTVASNTISITVESNLTASISGGTSPVCYNGDPGTITVTASGGTGTYTYQWYNGGGSISGATASTYDPGSLTVSNSYHCSVTSGGCGTVSTSTTGITVDANLTASISGGTSPICYNTDPGTITATGAGGTGTYTYQWYNTAGLISGATASTYDPGNITANDSYTCSVTSGSCGTAASNTISITVDVSLTASISGGTSPICYNSAPGTFTATGTGGTGTYTYQWYNGAGSISGATASTYAPGSITASDAYHCSVTSGSCGTANSNTISITVDANLSASISGGTTPICYNTSPGVFTATGSGGTGTYTYQWYNGGGSISGATASTYNPGSLTISDSYHCSVTSGGCGTVSTSTTGITVDADITASVTGGISPICDSTAPGTLTVAASGGIGTYTYQWYNGSGSISGATASTYAPGTLTTSDSYTCSVTSGSCGTATSNTISITVDANLSASISGGTTPVCYNSDPGIFTVTASGGTGTYTYQWYDSSGAINGAIYNYLAPGNLNASDSYYCSVTSGSCTAASNILNITVDSGILSASISGGTTPICYNTSPGTFTSSIIGTDASLYYQWYIGSNPVYGANASTFNPGPQYDSVSFSLIVSNGVCSLVTNTISISVEPIGSIPPTVSVSTNPVCYGTGAYIQIANSATTHIYQLLDGSGNNIGSSLTGNSGTLNLPTGPLNPASTVFQVIDSGGCSTTTANISFVVVNPDIAFGSQIDSDHFTFGTISSPSLPVGWSAPANNYNETWVLDNANVAFGNEYYFYNGNGNLIGNSSGEANIQTPTNQPYGGTVQLISSVIDARGYTNISIQWAAQKSISYTDSVALYYSIDGGAQWNPIYYTDVQANVTGNPWSMVNNSVPIKLPSNADDQAQLRFMWLANASNGVDYYSMNDIGIYGLAKIVGCGGNTINLPYLNTSCGINLYSLSAALSSPWPSTASFNYSTNNGLPSSPIPISLPSGTTPGTYYTGISVGYGGLLGDTSNVITIPVTIDNVSATVNLDNCSCNYITNNSMGNAYGNVVTVYATGGLGTGYYFNSDGIVDTLITIIDTLGNHHSGATYQTGAAVKGVFWSKADGLTHSYTITDGYCSTISTVVTQNGIPYAIPFGSATGQPSAITSNFGGGDGISGSFNNSNAPDPNINSMYLNGGALTCHHTSDFGNNWLIYQVNNTDSLGRPLAFDSTNNKAVVEINNYGTDLDSVEVNVYRDAYLPPFNNYAQTPFCTGYPGPALQRHFMIRSTRSTGANSFVNGIGVRLYFTDAEFQDLAYWSNYAADTLSGDAAVCAYQDTVSNINSIYVSKYTGPNEDGDYYNNSPSGLYRLFGKNASGPGNGQLSGFDAGQAALTTGAGTNLHYVEMSVKEFSEFWLSGSQGGGVALPVQMIYLEAEAMNNDSIQVRWATQTEINNRDFEVERSTDGNTWSTIGEVAGHDNSVVEEHYAFNDINVVPGVVYYYRLKQVDNNGNYQYTGIVQAKINAAGAFAVMNFVPNPTSGNIQLTVVTTKSQEITVDFYDVIGQKVYSSVQELTAGNNRIDFDLHRFAAGTYSAVVTSENQLYTKKVVITR